MQERIKLITQNLQDVIGLDNIQKTLSDNKDKLLKVYWGIAPTGRIHLGYFFPIIKILDLLDANCEVTILLADVHSFLDDRKSPQSNEFRTNYYKITITEIFKLLANNDPWKLEQIQGLKFVTGSSFQYSQKYIQQTLQLANVININEAKSAGTEVVKQNKNPKVTSLLYPIMQSLDEVWLDADLELGGIDQRKIFMFSKDHLKIGEIRKKEITYLMNPIVPGLSTKSIKDKDGKIKPEKMSSSNLVGKIDLLDSPQDIQKKINKTYCLEGEVDDNTLLILCKLLLFPICELLDKKFKIITESDEHINLSSFEELHQLFFEKKIHPKNLKSAVTSIITTILDPLRIKFTEPELMQLLRNAYE